MTFLVLMLGQCESMCRVVGDDRDVDVDLLMLMIVNYVDWVLECCSNKLLL